MPWQKIVLSFLAILIIAPFLWWEWIKIQMPRDLRLAAIHIISDDVGLNRPLQFVAVDFVSRSDIQGFAKDYGMGISNQASICEGSNLDRHRLLQGSPYVFDRVGMVDYFSSKLVGNTPQYRQIGTPNDNQGEYWYHIKIPLMTANRNSGWYNYNLRTTQANVCFLISAYSISFAGFPIEDF